MNERTTIQLSNSTRQQLRQLAAKRDQNYQDLLNDMIEVFNELEKTKTIISIPKQLASKIKGKIKGTDFSSISEYVAFMLRLLIYEEAKKEKIDEEKIKLRLKQMGYI